MARSTKRTDIEQAALRLFASKGFHGTSMPELAKAASVGPGTIYRHFDSKEALVNSLYQHWKAKMMADIYAELPQDVPWRERFRALWRGLVGFAKEHPDAVDFVDLHYHSDYLDDSSKQIEVASATALFALVGMAQAEQIVIDLPPPALIGMVYGAFLGLVRAEREGYLQLTDEVVASAEERVWAMIRR